MSSAIVETPASRRPEIRRATRSRRQGHCPYIARLRSSTSMIATRSLGGLVPIDRTSASYTALSRRARNGGLETAKVAAMNTGRKPLKNTRRGRRLAPSKVAIRARRLPYCDLDAPIAWFWSFVGRLDEQVGLTVGRHFYAGRGE